MTVPFCRTVTSTVIRCSTVYRRLITRSMTSGRSSCSASARKPTWPRFTPSSGTPADLVISATRSSVPSPPSTIAISASRAASGVARTTSAPGQRSSSASASTIRTEIPADSSMPTTSRALPTAAARPVCAITSTVRGPLTGVPQRRLGPAPPGPAGARHGAARGSTPRCRRPGQRAGRDPGHAKPLLGRGGRHAGHRLGAQRRVAHHPTRADPALAHLELRLDQQHEVGVRRGAGGQGGQHQDERDERQVRGDQPGRRRHLLRAQMPHVHPVHHDDPVVAAQRPGQLAVAHVHRHHVRRPGAEQHVGEAAGGRARVQAAPAGHPRAPANAASAPASLPPPRDAYPGSSLASATVIGASMPTWVAVLPAACAGHRDPPGADQFGRVLPGPGQAAPDQFGVQPSPRAHQDAARPVSGPGR